MSLRDDNLHICDRPAVDEWGIYDPEQAGLAAVRDRIEARRRASDEADAPFMAASMREAQRLMRAAASSDDDQK